MAMPLCTLYRNVGWWRLAVVVVLAFCSGHGIAQVDCLGVDGGTALPGTPCDDGEAFNAGDIWQPNCACVGYCGGDMGLGLPGDLCDDGNALTIMDAWLVNCLCAGTCANPLGIPGAPCGDGNVMTGDDMVDASSCVCAGTPNLISGRVFLDLDGDGVFGNDDLPIANRTVVTTTGFTTTSDLSGYYLLVLSPGTYSVQAVAGVHDQLTGPALLVDVSAPGASSSGNDIARMPLQSAVDLSLSLIPAHPGLVWHAEFG